MIGAEVDLPVHFSTVFLLEEQEYFEYTHPVALGLDIVEFIS